MDTENDIYANLPLTETTYFILLSLSPGSRHGYSIMKDVRQLSRDRVVLSTGTLYSALKRLLDQGWIRRAADPQGSDDARGRKAYCLTSLGQQILEAEVQRLQGLVNAAQLRPMGTYSD
jgi:DNA-binding PadR family transcriptional regulator